MGYGQAPFVIGEHFRKGVSQKVIQGQQRTKLYLLKRLDQPDDAFAFHFPLLAVLIPL
jgi:hypothetical protein